MSSLTADEAGRLQDFFFLLFFAPQIGEGVDDDAEDEVEDDDDDHEEEQQVVDHPGCKQGLLGKEEDTRIANPEGEEGEVCKLLPQARLEKYVAHLA